jgi:hypothetical protein
VRTYAIIYEVLDDVRRLMAALSSTNIEHPLGRAEVRAVFELPKLGRIAGSYVVDGRVRRGALCPAGAPSEHRQCCTNPDRAEGGTVHGDSFQWTVNRGPMAEYRVHCR